MSKVEDLRGGIEAGATDEERAMWKSTTDPDKSMCACGHTKDSHFPGECFGCTGPECLSSQEAAELDDLAEEHHYGILDARENDAAPFVSYGQRRIRRAARKFEPVTVVCDDCGEALAETYGTPYMEGTIIIRPELIPAHECGEPS